MTAWHHIAAPLKMATRSWSGSGQIRSDQIRLLAASSTASVRKRQAIRSGRNDLGVRYEAWSGPLPHHSVCEPSASGSAGRCWDGRFACEDQR